MMNASYVCAMCGETNYGAPYSGIKIPPELIPLTENAEDVKTDEIYGRANINLCEECAEIAREMALEDEVSPLLEMNAEYIDWSTTSAVAAYNETVPNELNDQSSLWKRMLREAKMYVEAYESGDLEYESEVDYFESKVLLLSFRLLAERSDNAE